MKLARWPFSDQLIDLAYKDTFVHDDWLTDVWHETNTLRVQKREAEKGWELKATKACEAFGRLVADGLLWNFLGIDFSQVQVKRHTEMDEDMIAVINWFWDYPGAEIAAWNHITADRKIFFRPRQGMVFAQQDDLTRFRNNGFIQFADLGVDVDNITAFLKDQWKKPYWDGNHARHVSQYVRTTDDLDSMLPLFKNQIIMELASYYMGSNVEITASYGFKVSQQSNPKNHGAANFHHDNCGTRLKLFLYLQDVLDDSGAPTEIVPGTQRLSHYQVGAGTLAYLSRDFVRSSYPKIQKMYGARGGGFMFDTNAIHRASLEVAHLERDAVVLEIHSSEKLIPKLIGGGTKCPHGWFLSVGTQFSAFPTRIPGKRRPRRGEEWQPKNPVEREKAKERKKKS